MKDKELKLEEIEASHYRSIRAFPIFFIPENILLKIVIHTVGNSSTNS